MGKKMSLIPFLFKPTDPPSSSSSNNSTWAWPAACGSPKTLSFRADKIMNSVYFSDSSRFTHPSEAGSIGVVERVEELDDDSGGPDSIEKVILGLKSDRLFFEGGESSSCMLTNNNNNNNNDNNNNNNNNNNSNNRAVEEEEDDKNNGGGNTRVMEMESSDPCGDFKKSMEEMAEAHGLKDNWEGLQELLGLYLKVNGKSNHSYVVAAFLDLLLALHYNTTTSSSSSSDGGGDDDVVGDMDSGDSTTPATQLSPLSALSFSSNYSSTSNSTATTPKYCLSSLQVESATPGNDDDEEDDDSTIS